MTDAEPARPPLGEALRRRLAAGAEPDGFLPFDRFMEIALYDPEVGYYARPRPPFGGAGDFYTAPRVSPLFAAALAEPVRSEAARLGPDGSVHLVDWGPGDGTLIAGILSALADGGAGPGIFEVDLVERAAPLARAAVARAEPPARRLGATVVRAETLSALGPIRGIVIANELFDAQPVRRARRTADGWEELGARLDGERLVAAAEPLRRPVGGLPLPSAAEPGSVFEWSPAIDGLLREAGDHIVAGRLVVLDYGLEEAELLAGHPLGTLQTIRGHREGEDPFLRPGETDLSTFVNLTRLRQAASRAGLRLRADRPQREALGDWGFPALLEAARRRCGLAEEEVRLHLAAKNLLFGFERFRVLEFEAGDPAAATSPAAPSPPVGPAPPRAP